SVRYQRAENWPAARDALERARGRLGEAALPDLRERVSRAQQNLELVTRLGNIRLDRAMIVGEHLDLEGADRDYREAFVTAGFDLDKLPAPVVARRIADSPIHGPLVAALDDWAGCAGPAALPQILQVARLADPDPGWRDHLRDPAIWTDLDALNRLAETARIAEQ